MIYRYFYSSTVLFVSGVYIILLMEHILQHFGHLSHYLQGLHISLRGVCWISFKTVACFGHFPPSQEKTNDHVLPKEIDINRSGGIDKEEFLGWVFETNNFSAVARGPRWGQCLIWDFMGDEKPYKFSRESIPSI